MSQTTLADGANLGDALMASADRYAMQGYVRNRAGLIIPGRSYPCKNADEARSKAERTVASKSAVGSAAFLLKGDEWIGSTEEPIAIAVFGEVPEGVSDEIPF